MFRWKMTKTKKSTRAERDKYPDMSTEAVRALIGEKTIFKDKWLHVTPDGNFIGLWEIMPAFRKDMVISLFGSCDKLPSPKKKLPVTPEMENCCFPVAAITTTAQRCRSSTPPPPASIVNRRCHVKTKSSKLQTLRPEDSAKCKKILKYNGYTNKVLLFPEESWARTAASCHWTLTPLWWTCSRCKVVEVTGTKRYTTYAKMVEMESGNLHIIGSFKKCADPDFKLLLTANISIADSNMGYCMTGSLERGSHEHNIYQTTHFAVVRRAEFNS